MSILVRFFVAVLAFLLIAGGAVRLNAQSFSTDSSGLAVGYWNDNVLFQGVLNRIFGPRTIPGSDDFQTANFWGRYASSGKTTVRYIDVYLNIVTSKAHQVRFDLLTARWLSEIRRTGWEGRYGFGMMVSGNFGGQAIQDSYHWATGVRQVIMPYYSKTLVHLALYGSVRAWVISSADLSGSGIVSASYLTGGGPSFAEGGASLAVHPATMPLLQAHIHAGFVSFYNAPDLYAPMFGSGFMTGYMLSVNAFSSSWISLWHTYNQYGRHQKHFGIAFSTYTIRIIDDVRFP